MNTRLSPLLPGIRTVLLLSVANGTLPLGSHAAERADVVLRAANPLPVARPQAKVELAAEQLRPHFSGGLPSSLQVCEAANGRPLVTQPVDQDGDGSIDEWIFQADFAAGQTREFRLQAAEPAIPGERRVHGRLVPERKDDFAWENDRIAFRLYGRRVEDHLVSSGIDVWCKRTRHLVIDRWYAKDDYHRDHGEGLDAYTVGTSRGCGGTAAVVGDRLVGSRNFVASRILARGPIRFMFEVFYEPWEAGGRRILEIKRVTLDAGSQLNRFESRFLVSPDPAGLKVAAGLARKAGSRVRLEPAAGWLRVWEPLAERTAGQVGLGLVWAPSAPMTPEVREWPDHLLAVLPADAAERWTYYAGAAWEKSGDFAGPEDWDAYLDAFARQLRAPIQVQLSRQP